MERSSNEDNNSEQQVVGTCCSCFGRHHYEPELRPPFIYHDALQGLEPVGDDDTTRFFDALEEEDEYPIISTSYAPKLPHRVSMLEPETLLRPDEEQQGRRAMSSRSRSSCFRRRRGSLDARRDLENPRVKIIEKGYPGQLTVQELAECQRFYHEIQKLEGTASHEIVYSLNKVEEEPYSLCRFMRATKFDANKMLERLKGYEEAWNEAKANNFYPDVEKAIGCPLSVFLQMYPNIYYGNAKNGCPVSYFKAGKLDSEGLLCLMKVADTARYFWHAFIYVFTDYIARAQAKDPNFVRCEFISVIDLKGLSSSTLNSEAMDTMKLMASIADCFPETLHLMIVLNTPSWFSISWTIIRRFIDPRTAKKIEIYSHSSSRGQERLAELIDRSAVPSDFGGSGPSTDTEIERRGQTEDGPKHRTVMSVVHVKRHEPKRLQNWIELQVGESMAIRVYTRSITGVLVSVYNDCGDSTLIIAKDVNKVDVSGENLPYSTEIHNQIMGPGRFSLELKGLEGDHHARQKKLPCGYFLVTARVQSTT